MAQFHKIFTELTVTYPKDRCPRSSKWLLQLECTCTPPVDSPIDLPAVCLLCNTCGLPTPQEVTLHVELVYKNPKTILELSETNDAQPTDGTVSSSA